MKEEIKESFISYKDMTLELTKLVKVHNKKSLKQDELSDLGFKDRTELKQRIIHLMKAVADVEHSDDLNDIAQTIDIETENIMKDSKRPKYLRLPISKKKTIKVMTPKKIISFKFDHESDFFVYGDERCEPKISLEALKEYQRQRLALIFFRKTGKEKQIALPVSIDQILKSRKHRLAVAITLPDQDETEFMRDELEIFDEKVDKDELTEIFLSELSDKLIISDLKRIIQLYHQTS